MYTFNVCSDIRAFRPSSKRDFYKRKFGGRCLDASSTGKLRRISLGDGYTPLHYAAEHGQLDLVPEELLSETSMLAKK